MKRLPYGKNKILFETHKDEMVRLKREGFGYRTIARQLSVSEHLVRYATKHIKFNLNKSVSNGLHFSYFLKTDKPFEEIKSKDTRKKYLIQERGHQCEKCQLTHWNGKPIILELHNHTLSKEECLLLCPNCHAQTDSWRGRKKKQLITQVM